MGAAVGMEGHHQLQCGNQCVRKGTRVATRIGLAQHDGMSHSGSQHGQLQCGNQYVTKGTRVATRIGLA